MSQEGVFASLPAGRRTWVVASVHGEAARLKTLHRAVAKRHRPGEGLVYLGNLLGYGTAVFETVQEILLFRRALLARPEMRCEDIVFLRGGQEETWHRLLQLQFAVNPREVLQWMLDHGMDATLRAYGAMGSAGLEAAGRGAMALTEWTNGLRAAMRRHDGHNALMSALKRAAFVEDRTLLFVNAGIDIDQPLAEQFDSFWWGATPFETITRPVAGFGRVVRGFDPRHGGVEETPATVTIDGGCGFGGPLLAACFDAGGDLIEMLET